jgi:molecular chaperone GrpE
VDERTSEFGGGDEADREQLAELEQRYIQVRADLENLRRREQVVTRRAVRRASDQLLTEWLDVVDNLERALAQDHPLEGSAVLAGVEATLAQARELLASHSILKIDAMGEAFDPERHEAVGLTEDGEPGVVTREVTPGYMIENRVLRAACVMVGRSLD